VDFDSCSNLAILCGWRRSIGGWLGVARKTVSKLPADTGMAFIIIQHLSLGFKRMMYETLARDTKMEIRCPLGKTSRSQLSRIRNRLLAPKGILRKTLSDLMRCGSDETWKKGNLEWKPKNRS
jgi:hypothetical protein